jgi:hypothetical protein
MEPRNGASSANKNDDTNTRRYVPNGPRISRAELERRINMRKRRPDSNDKASAPARPPIPPIPQRSVRDFASAAPLLMNAIEEEAPTLMWDSSHTFDTSMDISPRKIESAANVVRSTLIQASGAANARGAIPPIPKAATTRPKAKAKDAPRRVTRNGRAYPYPPIPQVAPERGTSGEKKQPTAQPESRIADSKPEPRSTAENAPRLSIRSPSTATRTRAVPPPVPPTSKRHVTIDVPQARRENASGLPATQVIVHASNVPPEPAKSSVKPIIPVPMKATETVEALRARLQNASGLPATQVIVHASDVPPEPAKSSVKPIIPVPMKATETVEALRARLQNASRPAVRSVQRTGVQALQDRLAAAASKSAYPRKQVFVEARPQFPATLIGQPAVRTTRSRAWLWTMSSSAAIVVLLLAGRFLFMSPSFNPTNAPAPVTGTNLRSETAGVPVDKPRSNAASATTVASAAILAAPQTSQVQAPSTDRAIQGVQINNDSVPGRTIVSSRSYLPAVSASVTSKNSALSIRRNRSQVFRDDENTPQAGPGRREPRDEEIRVNESVNVRTILTVSVQETLPPVGFWSRR